MPATETLTGGCQCGAVRYRIAAALENAEICHCRMCQKAHGAPVVAWAVVPAGALRWTRGEPSMFRSSGHAARGFCNRCGTPMVFRRDGEDTIDIALATLDHPQDVAPAIQYGIETRMPWFAAAHTLPEETRPASGRSFQHPDHETQDWPGEEGHP